MIGHRLILSAPIVLRKAPKRNSAIWSRSFCSERSSGWYLHCLPNVLPLSASLPVAVRGQVQPQAFNYGFEAIFTKRSVIVVQAKLVVTPDVEHAQRVPVRRQVVFFGVVGVVEDDVAHMRFMFFFHVRDVE